MKSIISEFKDNIIDEIKKIFLESDISSILEIIYPEMDEHGDICINIAMKLAKELKKSPRDIATLIINKIENNNYFIEYFSKITIAGPGFINFFFSDKMLLKIAEKINTEKNIFGTNDSFKDKKIIIEFVSANPTGPLTIAHARQSVVGDVLHRIFTLCGAKAHKEYYLNDKGVQISTLGKSVFSRYLELNGKESYFEETFYQGEYIIDIAKHFNKKYSDKYINISVEEGGNIFKDESYKIILKDIIDELAEFKVVFDSYFSEKSLESDNKINTCLEYLKKKGYAYESEGALWFASSKFGDDKDRVLIKSNGEKTYLASDIPYHKDKLERGFDLLINLLGPDHHGYIPRLKASIEALSYNSNNFKPIIVQLTTLYKGSEQLRMSTRKAQYITLRQLIDEVGIDAARYFFARRKTDSHLDFDLELAKKQTPDNPVFYVQYAGARINSIIKKAKDKYPRMKECLSDFDISYYSESDKKILKKLYVFPEIVEDAAKYFEPQKITLYLEEAAGMFQSYYSGGNKVITEDEISTIQKIKLISLFKQVIENGLDLLGIKIPHKM